MVHLTVEDSKEVLVKKIRQMVQGAIAALFALTPLTASANPPSVPEDGYRIVNGPNADSTYVAIGRRANLQTERFAEQFKVTEFDIRRDNPTRTLAICMKDGRSINLANDLWASEGRQTNAPWNGCEAKGGERHVYLIPGETLEITGKKYMTPQEAEKALLDVEKLRACTDLDCVKQQVAALGSKIEIALPAAASPANPATPQPQDATPAPQVDPPAENKTDSPAAPVENPSVPDESRVRNVVDPALVIMVIAFAFLALFAGFLWGRYSGNKKPIRNERDDVTKVTREPLRGDIGEAQHEHYKSKLTEAYKISDAQKQMVRQLLDDWGVIYNATDEFEILLGKVQKRVTEYRKGKEDGDTLRAKLSQELKHAATDDVTPLTELHAQVLQKAINDALASAPTVVPEESDELKTLRADSQELAKQLAPFVAEYEILVPADMKLSNLFKEVSAEWKKRMNESGLDGLRILLYQYAGARDLKLEQDDGKPPNALKVAKLLQDDHFEKSRELHQKIRDAEVNVMKARGEGAEEAKKLIRSSLEGDAKLLGITFTDDTLFEDLYDQVFTTYRRIETQLGSMKDDIETAAQHANRIEELSERLKELDFELKQVANSDRSQYSALLQESAGVLAELEERREAFEKHHKSFLGISIYSEAHLYFHRRMLEQEFEHAHGVNGVMKELDSLGERRDSDLPSSDAILANRESLKPPAPPTGLSIHDETTVTMSVAELVGGDPAKHLNGNHKNGVRRNTRPFPAVKTPSTVPPEPEVVVIGTNHSILIELERVVSAPPYAIEDAGVLQSAGSLVKLLLEKPLLIRDDALPSGPLSSESPLRQVVNRATWGSLPTIMDRLKMPVPVKGQKTHRPPDFQRDSDPHNS